MRSYGQACTVPAQSPASRHAVPMGAQAGDVHAVKASPAPASGEQVQGTSCSTPPSMMVACPLQVTLVTSHRLPCGKTQQSPAPEASGDAAGASAATMGASGPASPSPLGPASPASSDGGGGSVIVPPPQAVRSAKRLEKRVVLASMIHKLSGEGPPCQEGAPSHAILGAP
jgi:hypothetical protein